MKYRELKSDEIPEVQAALFSLWRHLLRETGSLVGVKPMFVVEDPQGDIEMENALGYCTRNNGVLEVVVSLHINLSQVLNTLAHEFLHASEHFSENRRNAFKEAVAKGLAENPQLAHVAQSVTLDIVYAMRDREEAEADYFAEYVSQAWYDNHKDLHRELDAMLTRFLKDHRFAIRFPQYA